MKAIAILSPLLLAACVSARSRIFESSNIITPLTTGDAVPGKNPLKHCDKTDEDILDLKKVDLSPNPPIP
jgi:hypothetical protein